MDQLILIVDPFAVTLAMARLILAELDEVGASGGRIHVVVVDRSHNLQIAWNEVEQALGREIRAVFSDAPDLAQQASRNGTPMVIMQPNSLFANQIAKFAEDLNARIKTLASGQLTH
jgi:MinD-like ATPase involved in chromosome partitioning or flagellar assembly